MKLLKEYKNGNYKVYLFDDGTKVRVLPDGENDFHPAYPENIDIKITNKCLIGCPYCHENSIPDGAIGNISDFLDSKLLASLHPGTELAIGGGALSTIDGADLTKLLGVLNAYEIISNITINAQELSSKDKRNHKFSKYLSVLLNHGYIHGLGISYSDRYFDDIAKMIKKFPNNVVVHTIAGVTTKEQYEKLAKLNCKILILGYKTFRRGTTYFDKYQITVNDNIKWLSNNVLKLKNHFATISFDNLATEQLHLQEKVSKKDWDKYYMGDDGTMTMYIDLVNMKFAQSSTQPVEERQDLDMSMTIEQIFNTVRNMKGK